MFQLSRFVIGCVAAGLFLSSAITVAAPVQGVLERPAMKVRNASKCGCVLMDVAFAGHRLVAVGERGIVLYSDDGGDTWDQAEVPVGVTLTAVTFSSPLVGWAVGHGGVVLQTRDSGETWHRQLEGTAVAQMALENARAQAERAGPEDAETSRMMNNAILLVEDGPDKPFLDLYFRNDREGFIVGAYGLIFRTGDGGATWRCIMDRVENPGALHLYAIHASDDTLYIAGEQGLFLVSSDGGDSFRQVETPYFSTFFDVESLPSGEVVLVGLRGSACWSADGGQTFTGSNVMLNAVVEVSFADAVMLPNGTLLFANQAGLLQASYDQGRTILPLQTPQLGSISSILPMDDGDVMTVGTAGAVRIELPSPGFSPGSSSPGTTDKGGQP
jgi:photosystem II stability/assembly factor-like uncharacterized protein